MTAPANARLASVVSMTADRLADEWPAAVIANLRRAAQRLEAGEEISEALKDLIRAVESLAGADFAERREALFVAIKRARAALEAVRDKP